MKQICILTLSLFLGFIQLRAQTIWTGTDLTFTKTSFADWTLPENQDAITSSVVLTRQNSNPLYNYQHWQSTYGVDAVFGDICKDFNNVECGNPSSQTFTPQGGTNGLKWAILDDTGSHTDWSGFPFYGTLGNSSNFYSFRNVVCMLSDLENGYSVTSIDDNFTLNGENSSCFLSTEHLVAKKLGVWIIDENIYFTLTFKTWGLEETPWGPTITGGALSYTRSTDQALNMDVFDLDKHVTLHPNPSSEFIQISSLKSKEPYSIFNIIGAEIKNGVIDNDEKIDIRNFTNGLYFVKFENGNIIKFLKK